MVLDEVGCHGFGLGVFTYREVALNEKLHTCFLVYFAIVGHILHRGHMLNSKLEVVNKHLEDGLLAGRLVVLLGHLDDLGNQGYVAKEEHHVIVLVGAVEVGAALVSVAGYLVERCYTVDIGQHGVGILDTVARAVVESNH